MCPSLLGVQQYVMPAARVLTDTVARRCPPSAAGSSASGWGCAAASALPASAMSGDPQTALLQAFLATTAELRDRVRPLPRRMAAHGGVIFQQRALCVAPAK